VTISTHTALASWWRLFETDRAAYEARQAAVAGQMLEAAGRALPGLGDSAGLVLPGTPVTFQRFTRRAGGWVGGFPQTSLFRAWGPRLADGLWMVGDSIFPGQSTAAVALGGLRVGSAILTALGDRVEHISPNPAKAVQSGTRMRWFRNGPSSQWQNR
jgi:phytoene dehydrogenase-like protein